MQSQWWLLQSDCDRRVMCVPPGLRWDQLLVSRPGLVSLSSVVTSNICVITAYAHDCSGQNLVCDPVARDGSCRCRDGFGGPSCQCVEAYWSASLLVCRPACQGRRRHLTDVYVLSGHGVCDPVSLSGGCLCEGGFGGVNCLCRENAWYVEMLLVRAFGAVSTLVLPLAARRTRHAIRMLQMAVVSVTLASVAPTAPARTVTGLRFGSPSVTDHC